MQSSGRVRLDLQDAKHGCAFGPKQRVQDPSPVGCCPLSGALQPVNVKGVSRELLLTKKDLHDPIHKNP